MNAGVHRGQHRSTAFTDRGTWASGTAYLPGELVVSGGFRYICNTRHTSGASFAGDSALWTATDVNKYDPRTQGYNFTESSLSLYRAALARVRSTGAGNFARIVCLGDSITRGQNSTLPEYATGYPGRLISYLNGQAGLSYYLGQSWPINNAFDSSAALWWTSDNSTWPAVKGDADTGNVNWFQNATNGAGQLTLHVANATTVRLYAMTDTASKQFTYSVDGAAAVNSPTPSGSQVYTYITIALGAVGSHTVAINAPATGSAFIMGAEAYNSANSGVMVTSLGVGNATSSNLGAATGYTGLNAVKQGGYDLAIVMYGTNDASTSVPVATYQANIAAIISTLRAVNCDVLLMVPPNRCTSAATFSADGAYNAALYALADTYNLPLWDITKRWPSTFTAVTSSPYSYEPSAGVHPTDKGYADMAQGLRNALAAAG